MRETSITIQRPDGTVVAQHVLVQVDQSSTKEVLEHLALADHHGGDMFKVQTRGWWPLALIRRGDLLIDEQFVDADNKDGNTFGYRVISRPKDYWLDHQECTCDSIVGN